MEKYKYFAIVSDRLQSLPDRKTRDYQTHQEAYNAGWKLAKKHFTEDRAEVYVRIKE